MKRRRREAGAVQILEEAFFLARSAGVESYCLYYLGAIPWALGLLYFVADMSRSSLADRDAAFAALWLSLLWFWRRYCQAAFCARLWDRLNPGHRQALASRERFRALGALWFAQAFRVPLLALGLFFAVPLGWIVASLQNLNALALTQDLGERPWRTLVGRSIRYSHEQWAQNHSLLLIFLLAGFCTWVNLVGICVLVPGFAKSLFGVESPFTVSPLAATANTTFLLSTVLLTLMVVDPLVNAAYVLRCFYASSRSTGADLLSRLASCRLRREEEARRERGIVGRVAGLVLFASVLSLPTPGGAQEGTTSTAEERFRQELTETLAQKKYQWKLPRATKPFGDEGEESWIARRLTEVASSVRRLVKTAGDWVDELMRRFHRKTHSGGKSNRPDPQLDTLGSMISLVLVVVVLGAAIWLAILLYRRYRGRDTLAAVEEKAGGVVDLNSEEIIASQLHEDEWMRLAREQIEKGEERLAIRALFLATLAHLGERGLLKIARFKSNRDYRRELGLRARTFQELHRAFDENTLLFERVWYGLHSLGQGAVDAYLKNHGRIAAESAKVSPQTVGGPKDRS